MKIKKRLKGIKMLTARVKTIKEIFGTDKLPFVTERLFFSPEMIKYCGTRITITLGDVRINGGFYDDTWAWLPEWLDIKIGAEFKIEVEKALKSQERYMKSEDYSGVCDAGLEINAFYHWVLGDW